MNDQEGSKSKFNAGVAMAERLDAMQRAINVSRFNPLAPNPQTGKFGYEVMLSANDSLLNECWAKLSKSEQTEGVRMRKIVHLFIKLRPPITKINQELKIKHQNYEELLELLDAYEKMNKTFLDKHDLNAPNRDEDNWDEL